VSIDVFVEKYGVRYARASERLTKDKEALPAFYDMPAEHRNHLRTTNPIKSEFAYRPRAPSGHPAGGARCFVC
jgi:transposase-like protein